MGRIVHNITTSGKNVALFLALFCVLQCISNATNAQALDPTSKESEIEGLRYPIEEDPVNPFSTSATQSPLLLKQPSNFSQEIEYNPETKQYELTEKVGKLDYRPARSMSMEEYREYESSKSQSNYWKEKSLEESGAGPSFLKNLRLGNQSINKVFGSDLINIKTQGNAELIFGYTIRNDDNPQLPLDNQKTGSFLFKEKIMVNVNGNIGDKFELELNYNTEATFDFENKTKLEYVGKEDEIIKKIEAGDVSFDVPGTLITGSQSLFGAKTELQFGKLFVTTVVSHQRGESSTVTVQGGAQLNDFEVEVDEYDANRHYFLTHFFRDHYNEWLENLPYIESQLKIQQIEVWVTNRQDDYTESRNVVAFMDLAEGHGPDPDTNFFASESFLSPQSYNPNRPSNNASNRLYGVLATNSNIRDKDNLNRVVSSLDNSSNSFTEGTYAKLENARPLSDREYTVNRELGYISLNSPLRNDEILAVAFTFKYRGETYRVGELTSDVAAPNVLILKLLKGTISTPKYPNWDLMMKNIYSIGAYQVSPENFVLNVLYKNDNTGVPVNYLSEDSTIISAAVYRQPLLKVLELDNLDSQNEPYPNGLFDFVEGVTVISRNGRIIFPLVEPFGEDLRDKIVPDENLYPRSRIRAANRIADKYVFDELYSLTPSQAEQVAEKNKFVLRGQYESSSGSDIQLNAMNISQGSVKATAGGIALVENQDYTVDYTLGRVKIINPGLMESGTPITISVENNSLFNLQTKTLLGTHFDYRFSENFNIGATFMRLKETPYTKKVNMGDEPISNIIWGLNASYRTKSQLLTTMVDKLPLIETKEPSSILLEGEFAQLIPGQAKVIGKNGQAYIDDFEAAQTEIDMKSYSRWAMASAPIGNTDFIRLDSTDLATGFGRAKLAWYVIDPLFYKSSGLNPGNQGIETDKGSHYARRIREQEIFPEKENEIPGESYLSILDLAYYPSERGPYNFTTKLNNDGTLPDPENNWGAIMRDIYGNTDFETSNIEFIEFWLMDPFLENTNHAGGEFYIHLGEISEDILHDDKKAFESGLPDDPAQIIDVDTTVWGRVPRGQAYNNNFLSDYQDIGLDGLNDADEKSFFDDYIKALPQTQNNIINEIRNDPSGDNFRYFLDAYHDNKDHGIFERYKNYNNFEGNTPYNASQNTNYSPSNSNEPDIEDINDDNTKNELESYFQYRVNLSPDDLKFVGENYIVDMVRVTVPNYSTPVKWYQFRIPLADYERRVGSIEDFKSIRFMRVALTGFQEEVKLRFATLDLIRSDWRQYKYNIREAGPVLTELPEETVLEVSAVNIEENSQKSPVNYVLPPNIDRVIDPSNPQVAHLNEQSLLLKVKDLEDGDARAVFKNEHRDLRQYKQLKMWIHAEALPQQEGSIDSSELTAFIRIGSDYVNNYYEYEIPLILTPHNISVIDNEDGRREVWPNELNLTMQKLVDLKKKRNRAVREDPSNYSVQSVYMEQDGKNTLKVRGNPNLGDIRQIMLGVRNPGDQTSFGRHNDGLPKSAEVWFNELRVSDFDNKGGWATNGRAQFQLADFGVVSVAGSKSTPGFGSIEEKVGERSMEEINQYDISTNLEMGKMFPEKAKVSIPLYVGASKTIINPEYFPKDPDIKFKDVLNEAETEHERDSLKRISQDHTSRASINVTNVRWNKKFKKLDILSPANLSTSVGYTQTLSRNYTTDYNNLWKYNAGINYTYNNRPKTIQPFRKSKALRKPSLRIIRDFNFNPYPGRFTFGTNMARDYQEVKMRNVFDDVDLIIEPTVNKDFVWDRTYGVKWDLSRSLKATYSANNAARIQEPYGQSDLFKDDNEVWKDSVWNSIKDGGKNMNFNQDYDLTYNVPINKIPMFNWVSLNTSYGGSFNWVRGPEVPDRESDVNEFRDLGHTIKNSNNIKASSNLNIRSLYMKSKYLKKLESKYSKKKGTKVTPDDARFKEVTYEKRTFFKKDQPRSIVHKLKTEDVTVTVLNEAGEKVDVYYEIEDENKVSITATEEMRGVTVIVVGRIQRGENPVVFVAENSIRMLTGIKSINVSWSRTSGSILSGYRPSTNYFGFDLEDSDDDAINSDIDDGTFHQAPGFGFASGAQDPNYLRSSIDNNWITKDQTFSQPYEMNMREELNIRLTYEPFKGLRIDLNANRSYSEYNEQLFFYDPIDYYDPVNHYNNFFIDNMYTGGSFSISVISIKSAFEKPNAGNKYQSESFENFKEFRSEIARRRSTERGETIAGYENSLLNGGPGEYYGYSHASQDVLVPAFLAAYTGAKPNNVTFEEFFWNMMPNWKVTFDGLSKLEPVQKYFKSVTLTHSYKSTYSISGFGSNVGYQETYSDDIFEGADIQGLMTDAQDDFIAQFQYNSVSIKESINPLIGFDFAWHNSLLTKFEIGKKRTLLLSLNNSQINETRDTDYTFGAGYKFKEVPIWISTGGNRKQIKSDLNLRLDYTVRDNITFIRFLNEGENLTNDTEVTTGNITTKISLVADYVISENFSIQFFFDRDLSDPQVKGQQFRNSTTQFGFSMRLTL